MIKKLLIIPVQSVNDVITNSSSELFIMQTDKTCEEVNTILKGFTSGFQYPEVFSLSEFRKYKDAVRSGEIEESWRYPCTINSIVADWFNDSGDELSVLDYRKDFLFDPYKTEQWGDGWVGHSYNPNYQEEIHRQFIDYINEHWDKVGEAINEALKESEEEPVEFMTWATCRSNRYEIQHALSDDFINSFLKNYAGPKPTVWDIPPYDDAVLLDGKILVLSEDDNSIPYDTWDQINKLFNARNKHLG